MMKSAPSFFVKSFGAVLLVGAAALCLSGCDAFKTDDDDDGGGTAAAGPVHAAAGIAFTDLDLGTGEAAGTVTITKAADESDVTHYVLYWGGSAAAKLAGAGALIAEFPKGGALTKTFPPDTALPAGATHLVVVTRNAEGEMASGVGCAADVKGTSYTGTEGTAAAPVFLAAGFSGAEYSKQIGKGKSCYYTTALGEQLIITLRSLTDDVDIIYYGTDSTFSTPVSENSGPDYGRLREEYINEGSSTDGEEYYFIIDGGDTGYKLEAPGASFQLSIESHNPEETLFGGWNDVGSSDDPVLLRMGFVENVQVGDLGAPLGESYYKVPSVTGKEYLVNAGDGPDILLYTDQFMTAVSEPVTATGEFLFIKVVSTGPDTQVPLEVVGAEGSSSAPVYLKTVKTNYGMVNNTSSYYSFDVTQGQSYTITVSEFSTGAFGAHNVDLFVFPSGNFTGTPTSSATSSDPESVTVTAQASTLLVRVDDKSGAGGVFTLKVE